MNCANHADASAVAYCRTCGKPLCATCTRDVRGVIYCENCIAARLEGTAPPAAAFVPPAATVVPPATRTPAPAPYSGGGPNPTVAGILAGFFPFGVGAVYNSQYAKGFAHLIIFTVLVAGHNVVSSDALHVLLGLSLAFFYFYQIIDAVRSAKAIQMGQPAPDPFGLAQSFGGGERVDTSKVPTGAIILIILGVLFLLHTAGLLEFDFERFSPLLLILLGGLLFARRWGFLGGCRGCKCDRCRMRGLMGPAVLVTLGVLFELEALGRTGFHRTWPVLLLVIGLVKLLQGNASSEGHIGTPPLSGGTPPTGIASGEVQPPPAEVKHV